MYIRIRFILMPTIILMKMISLCSECKNSPGDDIELKEIKMFSSKKTLYEYINSIVHVEGIADDMAEIMTDKKEYPDEESKNTDFENEKKKIIDRTQDFIYAKFNYGFKFTGDYSDCRRCGRIYIYGNYKEMNNIDFAVSEYDFPNINVPLGLYNLESQIDSD